MGTCRFFGGIRIATPACAPVRNDIFLRVRRVSSGGTHGCRPTRGNRGAQQIGRGSTPPLRRAGECGAYRRRGEGTPPYGVVEVRCRRVVGGNRRSAAGGGRSEPVSRKCPDWRPRQWTGIGWHDGGQSPTPTDAWQGNAVRGSTDCHTSLRAGLQ